MTLLQLTKDWFGGTPKEKDQNRMGDKELGKTIAKNICPDCKEEGFFEGPSGGLNVNIKCANTDCGSRFNIAAFGGELIYADRISEPQPDKKEKT